jgi:hypothetical protein
MRSWKRLEECPICGKGRCIEKQWIIYCFRFGKAYNKKQIATGVGKDQRKTIGFTCRVLREELPKQGVLEGQSPSKKQKTLDFRETQTPYEYED